MMTFCSPTFALLSTGQIVIVLAIVLLLFGANRLPDLMRSLGRSMTEFKKGVSEGSKDDEEEPKKVEHP